MQSKLRLIVSIVAVLLIIFFIIHATRDYLSHKGPVTINHNIDSVEVYYRSGYHTIYITDTLSFAGEHVPIEDTEVRAHLKYIISHNMNWFPRAYNELEVYPDVFKSIKNRLISLGVPPDFTYVAFNESHLENVVSENGMCGIWQLEAATARRFGLTVDSAYDGRMDIAQSTVAAAHYISYLHSIYGDWIVAAAAYNCGPGIVNYNFQYLKVKNMDDFFRNYYLSSYVMHSIAFKVIFRFAASELAKDKGPEIKSAS